MGKTSLPATEATRERIERYRVAEHDSIDDVLNDMMNRLPTVEEMREGCVQCGEGELPGGKTPDEWGGIAHSFSHEISGSREYYSNYFCSPECAQEFQEEAQRYVPEEPDLVVIGGKDEMRFEVEGARFHIDETDRSVGFDIPGALTGTDSHGNEFDYVGEPVYIKNDGEWVQSGIAADIINEETWTAVPLEKDFSAERLHHPDDEIREQFLEERVEHYTAPCPQCGEDLRFHTEMDDTVECDECEAVIERPEPPEDHDDVR